MAKRGKKKQQRISLKKVPQIPREEKLVLRAVLPGAYMFQGDYPLGVPTSDSGRRVQVGEFAAAAAFQDLAEDERMCLWESAAKTYARSAYHLFRFRSLRQELDRRREAAPGMIFYDGLLEYVHFELQAFCGACRTFVDELVYLIARRHGAEPKEARRRPWETSDLMDKPLPLRCDVPEVQLLLSSKPWFQTLNAYRNSFFHHGWRHGSGHFSSDDLRSARVAPAGNGLLLPDFDSLLNRKKPLEWAWARRATVDAIVEEVRVGLENLVDDLGSLWNVPVPPAGTMPPLERPNLIVSLERPAVLLTPGGAYVPVFSTREFGLKITAFAGRPDLELVDVPVTTSATIEPSVILSGKGLSDLRVNPAMLSIVLDPVVNDDWSKVAATAKVDIPIAQFTDPLMNILLPVRGLARVWLWTRIDERSW